ncbi:MAG: aminodeoxychorismate/anthranilate synthase component II [Planctomycetes bacterium]|jgi:anthranilate synthase component 2|nr:aminodeoxychorismate/anthranilate synthase component II [Planctomycetota bacterium]
MLLFLENDDSFSWNVIDRLPFPRERIAVIPGADRDSFRRLLPGARSLVVGPGPGDPLRAGHLVDAVLEAAGRGLAVLGVCLGHQAVGIAYGARLRRSEPAHGRREEVRFAPSRLFPGFGGEVTVMRYHSLALDAVRFPLRVVSATASGLPMAVEHETLPVAGVQFHPDSHGTPRGEEMLAAFFRAVGRLP